MKSSKEVLDELKQLEACVFVQYVEIKILIIEDDIDLNELLVLKLKSSGYEVISLADFWS